MPGPLSEALKKAWQLPRGGVFVLPVKIVLFLSGLIACNDTMIAAIKYGQTYSFTSNLKDLYHL